MAPDGRIDELPGAVDGLRNQLANETHLRLHWQDEADRLNGQVHALRRELESLRSHDPVTRLRALHKAAHAALPMVQYADVRWDPTRRSNVLTDLEVALAAAEQVMLATGRTTGGS